MPVLQREFPHATQIGVTVEAWVGDGGVVAKGDIVAFDAGGVGEVWMHVVADDHGFSCVSDFDRVSDTTFIVRNQPRMIPTTDIRQSLTYSRCGEHVNVVPPL